MAPDGATNMMSMLTPENKCYPRDRPTMTLPTMLFLYDSANANPDQL